MRNKFQNSFQRLGGLQEHGKAENLIEIGLRLAHVKVEIMRFVFKVEKGRE